MLVVPVHGVHADGTCRCTKGVLCPTADRGKHPIEKGWQQLATTDATKIAKCWETHPDANVGGLLPPGELVVDVDPRNSGDGALDRLIATLGELPPTVTTDTGGGGVHLRFRVPENVQLRRKLPGADGIDFLTAGRLVVLPPSRHHTGGRYVWRAEHAPGEIAVADLPAVWLEALRAPERGVVADAPAHGVPREERIDRGQKYTAAVPQAIERGGGYALTKALTGAIARGLDLSPADTLDVLRNWNAANTPPWSEAEILAKAKWWRERAYHRPLGYLLTSSNADPAAAARAKIARHRQRITAAKIKPQYRKVLLAMLSLIEADSTTRRAIGVRGDVPAMAGCSWPTAARWMRKAAKDGWFVVAVEAAGIDAKVYELPAEEVTHERVRTPEPLPESVSLFPGLRVLGAQAFHVSAGRRRGLGPSFEVVANWLETHGPSSPREIADGAGLSGKTVKKLLEQGWGQLPVGGLQRTDRSNRRRVSKVCRDGRTRDVWIGERRWIEGARPLPFAVFVPDVEGERWCWATESLRRRLELGDDVPDHEVHARALDVIERWCGLDGVAERKIEQAELDRQHFRKLVAASMKAPECPVDIEAFYAEAFDALVASEPVVVTEAEIGMVPIYEEPPWARAAAVVLADIDEQRDREKISARHAAARRRPSRTAAGGAALIPIPARPQRLAAAGGGR